ncbi:DUF4270 family protein [Mucilaginibacter sp. X5P1]|uniref:DUF4270 family protein n=1 Tax=Mucilaginibacter sp. X5P1 TaxID=2723088 RepID=UPI001619E80B|nr:DUF4270 family protein [Mucilaginibacter sp. X5P1]MBB6139157.1 hypothetical protein [Mucilaginibacter sp. X5P1]
MKFFRLDLLTLLISLFILNSCKNQDSIGLPANANGQLTGSLVDTATIFTNTTTDDSIVTSGVSKSPMGYFVDPALGTTTVNLITDLNLPGSAAYTIPTGTVVIDSAILILQYDAGFYGDSLTSKYKVNVYQLAERPYSASEPYYGNKVWSYNSSALLGSRSFYSRTHDTLKVDTIVSGGPDTLVKVAPQLRVPMDVNFIHNILFSSSAPVTTNLLFKNAVKGLYITIDPTQTTGAGGIFMIKDPATYSSIAIYERTINGSTIDTALVSLPISVYASQISHNYSTQVKAALNHTTPSDTTIYLQGLGGLRSKISFPYIQNLFKSLGGGSNVVINRAELVLTPVPLSDIPAYLTPQIKLSLYRYDIAHQRTTIEDATSTDSRSYSVGLFGGFYSPTTNNYHFLVTSYLQDLITGKTIDYGTFIGPIDYTNTSSVDVAATPETAGRTVAVGNSKTSPYRIKLNVIYTKIPKQ